MLALQPFKLGPNCVSRLGDVEGHHGEIEGVLHDMQWRFKLEL
jgi:hypothetical protein